MSPRPGTPSSPPSPSIFTPLRVVTMTGSTQDDLRADLTGSAAASWPHFSALHALGQSAGRGRSGNTWTTPPTGALTVSVVLRPLVPADRLAWLPLLAGLAVRDALAPLVDARDWQLRTKWPNDVIAVPAGPAAAPADVEGWGTARKVAGVLAELIALPGRAVPDDAPTARDRAAAIVLGIGVNVRQRPDQLPVPWAASLRTLGVETSPEEVREAVGLHLRDRLDAWEKLGGDPAAQGGSLARQLRRACATLGRAVSVETPTGPVQGVATDLDPGLVLQQGERTVVLQAGDVRLVRSLGRP